MHGSGASHPPAGASGGVGVSPGPDPAAQILPPWYYEREKFIKELQADVRDRLIERLHWLSQDWFEGDGSIPNGTQTGTHRQLDPPEQKIVIDVTDYFHPADQFLPMSFHARVVDEDTEQETTVWFDCKGVSEPDEMLRQYATYEVGELEPAKEKR